LISAPAIRRFDNRLLRLPFSGAVEQCYEHAAVVRPDFRGPLLTLLSADRWLVPWGACVPWDALKIRPGDRVTLADRHLTLSNPRSASRAARLQGRGLSMRLCAISPRLQPAALLQRLDTLELPPRTQALLGACEWLGSRVERQIVRQTSRELRKLTRTLGSSGRQIGQRVRGLSGLGSGQTPTGDDLLLGVAAVDASFRPFPWAQPLRALGLRQKIRLYTNDTTTELSAAMIEQAADHDCFPEPLLRFCDALRGPRTTPRTLRRNLARLVAVGAQSGCDMLAGVISMARALADSARQP
jgi:hypothetical protein